MKKKIVILIVLSVISLIVVNYIKSQSVQSDVSTMVRVQKPEVGELVESIQAPGEIKPLVKVMISAKVTGKVIALPYKEGDVVAGSESGDEPSLLVRIDSSDLEADLDSVEARYESQKIQLEVSRIEIENRKASLKNAEIAFAQAKRELDRNRELLKTHDVKESDVENMEDEYRKQEINLQSTRNSILTSELNLTIMENNLKIAEADIAKAKDALKYAEITSPMSGVVTQVFIEVGEIVTGATNYTGTKIMEVADLSNMLMAAQIDEVDVGKVAVGQRAKVKIQSWPDEDFTGLVTSKSLVMQAGRSGTKYCEVEILLDNKDGRIISGMTADAEIEIKVHKDVMKLPSQAVLGREWENLPKEIRDESEELIDKDRAFTPVVYGVVDGKSKVIPVKIGPSDLSDTIIEAGLSGDEEIVIGPFKELEAMSHDKAVKVEEDEDKDADAEKADKDTADTEEESAESVQAEVE